MILLPKNLRYLRGIKGFTQGQLAEKIGVKANTISNYEKGVSSPDFELLGKLVEIFDTDAHSLLYVDLRLPEPPVRRVSDIAPTYNVGNHQKDDRQEEDTRTLEEMRNDLELLKEAVAGLLREKKQ